MNITISTNRALLHQSIDASTGRPTSRTYGAQITEIDGLAPLNNPDAIIIQGRTYIATSYIVETKDSIAQIEHQHQLIQEQRK